jgi:hypothetical protein
MRSTNIVIFLVALNAAAFVIGSTLGPAFGLQPSVGGGGQIEQVEEDSREQFESSRTGVGEFVSATFMATEFVQSIDDVVFAGPNMLISLGAPSILITPFKGLLVLIVGIDIAEVLSGRVLS